MNKKQTNRFKKQNRILYTLKALYENDDYEDKGIDVNKMVGLVCIEFVCAERYTKELIKSMVNARLIDLIDKKLYYRVPKQDLEDNEVSNE